MQRSRFRLPYLQEMEKSSLRLASRGEPGLLVLSLGAEFTLTQREEDILCVPIKVRSGGLLLALPYAALDQQVLLDGIQATDESILGPNKLLEASLMGEDEEGEITQLALRCRYYVVDFKDDILEFLRDYDPLSDDLGTMVTFDPDIPYGVPSMAGIIEKVADWASQANAVERATFYSAREEPVAPKPSGKPAPKKAAAKRASTAALAERIDALAAQVQLLAKPTPEPAASIYAMPAEGQANGLMLATPKMPRLADALAAASPGLDPVHKAASLLPPPPKQRSGVPKPTATPMAAPGMRMAEDEPQDVFDQHPDHVLQALSQQSTALTALVAHLTAGGDGMMDLSASSSSTSTSTRGMMRREKMVSELAAGTSTFFLQVQQQIFRKMNPSIPVPKSEEELRMNPPSLLAYLERHGGYRNQRSLGIVLWMLGYALDAGGRGDNHAMKEHLALAVAAVEQCAVDNGDWGLGFLVSLAADPPLQLFQDKHQQLSMHQKNFGGLTPAPWSTVAVAFLKEMEVLNSKKLDLNKKGKAAQEEEEDSASPRRRPRYPKRPKAKPKGAADA